MRYVFNFWNLLAKMVDVFVLVYVPFRVLSPRRQVHNRTFAFLGSFLCLSLLSYAADFLFYPVPLWITLLWSLFLGLCETSFWYREPYYLKTVLAGTSVSTCMILHFFSGTLHYFSESDVFSPKITILMAIISIPLLIFLIRIAVVPMKKLPAHYGVSMSAVMVAMALCVNIANTEDFWRIPCRIQFCTYLLLMGIILYLYYLFFKIIYEYEAKETYALVVQQIKLQNQYREETMEIYREQRKLRHELKNHVFYMEMLLKQKKYSELDDYFKEIYRQEYGFDLIDSGNDAANALLNQKIIHASTKGIVPQFQVALPPALSVHEGKLCAVIANLLDNAIEASEKTAHPMVQLSIRPVEGYLQLVCRNTIQENVLQNNPRLKTTQKQHGHGLGLQVVQTIVEEYDGMIEYHIEGDMFVLSLMLRIAA